MIFFYSVLFGLLLIYTVFIILIRNCLSTAKLPDFSAQEIQTGISVVIPFRNEADNLPLLIKDLKSQEYPEEKTKFILIDDHSTDNSLEVLNKLTQDLSTFEVYSLGKNIEGKKHALNLGILKSDTELIVLTDADCRLKPCWLTSYNRCYLAFNKPDLIIGLVDMLPAKTVLQKIFRLEFLSLALTSSGAALLKKPIFCNGANLCFKKMLYRNIENLIPAVASGDDVFLLHHAKKNNLNIQLLNDCDNRVTTPPPENLSGFLKQRTRWASKSTAYKDADAIAVSMLIFCLSLMFLTGYIVSVIARSYCIVGSALLVKSLVDFDLFLNTQNWFKTKKNLWLIPLIEIFYPVYIVITVMLAIKKPFGWKGRKLY